MHGWLRRKIHADMKSGGMHNNNKKLRKQKKLEKDLILMKDSITLSFNILNTEH